MSAPMSYGWKWLAGVEPSIGHRPGRSSAGAIVTTRRNVRTIGRREAFEALAATAGLAWTAACGGSSSTTATEVTPTTGTGAVTGACVVAAEETAGPYSRPARDAQQPGLLPARHPGGPEPATLARPGAHDRERAQQLQPAGERQRRDRQCDASGFYSEYAQPGYNGTGQTYLRGLQTQRRRRPRHVRHGVPRLVHGPGNPHPRQGLRQRPRREDDPDRVSRRHQAQVYASGVYVSRGQSPTRNASDMVFADGTSTEMASVAGSVSAGFDASLSIGISV